MPLFWKEWKSAKWWSLLIMGIFLLMFLAINHSLQNIQEVIKDIPLMNKEIVAHHRYIHYYLEEPIFMRSFYEKFSNVALALIPIVIVMSTLLFHSDRKESVGAFVGSLPFTKQEQFRMKWSVGALVISIPFAISFILTIIMRTVNWGWIQEFYHSNSFDIDMMPYDTQLAVVSTLFQTYLFFMAFYSFLMLMQTLIANNIAASIIGSIVLIVPWFLLEIGSTTLSHLLQRDLRIYGRYSWFNGSDRWIFPYNLMLIRRVSYAPNSMSGNIVNYHYYWPEIILLLLIATASICAGIWFYGKNDNARNGCLTMFSWVETILIVGVTLCSSILGNNLLRFVVRQSNTIYEMCTLTISGAIGYLIIRKITSVLGRSKA